MDLRLRGSGERCLRRFFSFLCFDRFLGADEDREELLVLDELFLDDFFSFLCAFFSCTACPEVNFCIRLQSCETSFFPTCLSGGFSGASVLVPPKPEMREL